MYSMLSRGAADHRGIWLTIWVWSRHGAILAMLSLLDGDLSDFAPGIDGSKGKGRTHHRSKQSTPPPAVGRPAGPTGSF